MKKVYLLFLITLSLFSKDINFTNEELNFIKNSPKIKVALMSTFAPIEYTKNNYSVGVSIDMLDLISKKSGLKFEF
jgi:polar amino acid transport system substrate-binding protein